MGVSVFGLLDRKDRGVCLIVRVNMRRLPDVGRTCRDGIFLESVHM
jgi:hypothetical protein